MKVEGSVIESVDSHKTAAFSTEQCTSPSLFSMFEVCKNEISSWVNIQRTIWLIFQWVVTDTLPESTLVSSVSCKANANQSIWNSSRRSDFFSKWPSHMW